MALTVLSTTALLVSFTLVVHVYARNANDPARLVRGQEEWPDHVGCPTGYLRDYRPKAQKQFRPSYTICVKGHIGLCVPGTSWFMKDGRSCLKCLCNQGTTANCDEITPCPPEKPKFRTHHHFNCKRRDKKVCPTGCRFLSREVRCVNCDCNKRK